MPAADALGLRVRPELPPCLPGLIPACHPQRSASCTDAAYELPASRTHCANCCAPRKDADAERCFVCAHEHGATDKLLGPVPAPGSWASLAPPLPSKEEAQEKGLAPAAVALAVDDRLLLHRSGLPPHYER